MMQLLRSRSVGRLALLVSLCLNLLLAAYLATDWVRAKRAMVATAAPPTLIALMADRLPRADADILWAAYRAREGQFAEAQAAYAQALSHAAALLRQEPMAPEVLRAAVLEARDRRVRVGDLAIDTVLEVFPRISADGRRDLVGTLRTR